MTRSFWLAVVALMLGTEPGLAQFGGQGGQGNPAAPGPARNVMRQGMGMMGGGMGGMGGGMAGFQGNFPRRTVQVQFQGGKKIAGKMQLGHVFVAGELGQYMIRPEFVKIIRLATKGKGQDEEDGDATIQAEHEAVITTSGEEIRGEVQRQNWVLEVDSGTLTLNPENVRSMTFLPPAEPKDATTGQSAKGPPTALNVATIEAPRAVGLMVTGPKITRLAAASELSGDWIPIDLREPVEGRAMPIVAQGIVVYSLGSHVYAFGSEARRWDVLDLPEGTRANPIVSPGSARVQIGGLIHEFSAVTGKWKHIDPRAILDPALDKALKALQKPENPK